MDSRPPVNQAISTRPKKKRLKAFWTKQFYLWHWVSSAICLAAMLLFAVTGITLNNEDSIKVEPIVSTKSLQLPPELQARLASVEDSEADMTKPLPEEISSWLTPRLKTPLKKKVAEWSAHEIYLSLPRPGGDAWLVIDRDSGEVSYELTERGMISYLNDLHKGRNTGSAWSWFIDIFSIACLIFCLTGLALLFVHSKRRPTTWPIVAAGVLLPIVIVLFFIH